MTRDETVSLFLECEAKRSEARATALASGKSEDEAGAIAHDAAKAHWNAWAECLLAERKAMEASCAWKTQQEYPGEPERGENAKTKAWLDKAAADFSRCVFLVRGVEETTQAVGEAGTKKVAANDVLAIKSIPLEEHGADFSGFVFPAYTSFESTSFLGYACFVSASFQGNARFVSASFRGDTQFESVTFQGDAWFQSATFRFFAWFESAIFQRDVRFENTTFQGDALFQRTKFQGYTCFLNARFGDSARFVSADFQGDTRFESVTFQGDAWFQSATFRFFACFVSATFQRDVRFENTTFQGDALFQRATFQRDALFQSATFRFFAGFESATFRHSARFEGVRFHHDASFQSTSFRGNTRFERVGFYRATSFQSATFRRGARFENARFQGDARFVSATFRGDASFESTTFRRGARFESATFETNVFFERAQFHAPASFALVNFRQHATFVASRFAADASFEAIKGERGFITAGAVFEVVPDFIQAHFEEAPRLDNLKVGRKAPQLKELDEDEREDLTPDQRWHRRGFEESVSHRGLLDGTGKGSELRSIPARWRALKRLAIQGHDTERELEFHARELRSQRLVEDWPLPLAFRGGKAWVGFFRFWFGLFYELFSDFGRSLARPFIASGLVLIVTAAFYLSQTEMMRQELALQQASYLSASVQTARHALLNAMPCYPPPLTPAESWRNQWPWWRKAPKLDPNASRTGGLTEPLRSQTNARAEALHLAFRNAFVVLDGSGEAAHRTFGCLYGVELYGGSNPLAIVPSAVSTVSALQKLFSALMIFLFGLALRNMLKMK